MTTSQQRNLRSCLDRFLRKHYPNDLLMPVRPGTKHPEFAHKDGQWTWERLDQFLLVQPDRDVCVVLRELCVVDVDDEKLAVALEARFPVLETAPMEKTRRGRHYWFLRSDAADTLGYYDGAGQRMVKVDFKSVCRTGTGGVVVVAPSNGKQWVRRPWDVGCRPFEIPLDLLDAIAVPQAPPSSAPLLAFSDDDDDDRRERFDDSAGLLRSMAYFEPLFDESFDQDAPFPVPCVRAVFEEMMHVLRTNHLRTPEPSAALFSDMLAAADLLGAPPRLARRLRCGLPRFQLDAASAFPEWWAETVRERRWQSEHELRDRASILQPIDAALVASLKYAPLPRDPRWLLWSDASRIRDRARNMSWRFRQYYYPQTPQTYPRNIEPGQAVLDVAPEQVALPPDVEKILKRWPGRMVLAGGGALGELSTHVASGEDYDIFVVGMDAQEANRAVSEICEQTLNRVACTGNAVTFASPDGVTIQVILRLYSSIDQVVVGFDQAACKVAMWFDADRGVMTAACAPTWVPAMRHLAYPVDLAAWSCASVARTFKYHAKGFGIFVPGLRRDAVAVDPASLEATEGFHALLEMESIIYEERMFKYVRQLLSLRNQLKDLQEAVWRREKPCAARAAAAEEALRRVPDLSFATTREEYGNVLRKMRHSSDYTTLLKWQLRLWHAVRNIAQMGRRWIGVPGNRGDASDWVLEWRICDPSQGVGTGSYKPAPLHLPKAYDLDKLANSLSAEIGL